MTPADSASAARSNDGGTSARPVGSSRIKLRSFQQYAKASLTAYSPPYRADRAPQCFLQLLTAAIGT